MIHQIITLLWQKVYGGLHPLTHTHTHSEIILYFWPSKGKFVHLRKRQTLWVQSDGKPVGGCVSVAESNVPLMCVTLPTSQKHCVRNRKKSCLHGRGDWSKHHLRQACYTCQCGGEKTHSGLSLAPCLNCTHVLTTRKGLLRHCPENHSSQCAFINTRT